MASRIDSRVLPGRLIWMPSAPTEAEAREAEEAASDAAADADDVDDAAPDAAADPDAA